eukprot:763772-Hanusia_phi.AAC.3
MRGVGRGGEGRREENGSCYLGRGHKNHELAARERHLYFPRIPLTLTRRLLTLIQMDQQPDPQLRKC